MAEQNYHHDDIYQRRGVSRPSTPIIQPPPTTKEQEPSTKSYWTVIIFLLLLNLAVTILVFFTNKRTVVVSKVQSTSIPNSLEFLLNYTRELSEDSQLAVALEAVHRNATLIDTKYYDYLLNVSVNTLWTSYYIFYNETNLNLSALFTPQVVELLQRALTNPDLTIVKNAIRFLALPVYHPEFHPENYSDTELARSLECLGNQVVSVINKNPDDFIINSMGYFALSYMKAPALNPSNFIENIERLAASSELPCVILALIIQDKDMTDYFKEGEHRFVCTALNKCEFGGFNTTRKDYLRGICSKSK